MSRTAKGGAATGAMARDGPKGSRNPPSGAVAPTTRAARRTPNGSRSSGDAVVIAGVVAIAVVVVVVVIVVVVVVVAVLGPAPHATVRSSPLAPAGAITHINSTPSKPVIVGPAPGYCNAGATLVRGAPRADAPRPRHRQPPPVANRTVSPVLPCTRVRPSNLVQRLACAGVLTVAIGLPDAAAKREKIPQVTPAKRSRPARPADLSRGGERRGGIEFALGSVTAALTGVLLGRGIWELVIAERAVDKCADGAASSTCPPDPIDPKPGRGGRIAGGLSLGFAVPVAIASGFLFRYAVRIRRDYKRFERESAASRDVALSPWVGRSGGGVGLRLRF